MGSTELQEAAQQALEAMTSFESGTNGLYEGEFSAEIAALRAALENEFNPDWDRIEPLQENLREHMAEIQRLRSELALQRFTDVNQEIEAALAEPVQEPVAAWENKYGMKEWEVHALRAGWMPAPPQRPADPVQEPVAWMHTDPDNPRVKFLVWRENEPAYRGVWIKTPLYAAPPQRKPLTEEEIQQCFKEAGITIVGEAWTKAIRAIERAHGIGGQP